jgi:bis(5'-nucleosyl)-tetraphosphatase (symmetrical)
VGRRIYVGDVQGCREELEKLLEAVRFDPAADRLEPVGDLVNRGPDSLGVLRLCMQLGAGGVLGNHDVLLLRTAAGLRAPGRKDTFGDVLTAPDRYALLAWIRERPFAKSDRDVIAVHAGLHPAWGDPVTRLAGLDPVADHPDARFAVSVRWCSAAGERPEDDDADPPASSRFRPWFELWPQRAGLTVVFGHWARRGLVLQPGFRGLDTGCVWGGHLTAWIAEEDRLVQVPAARQYAKPKS